MSEQKTTPEQGDALPVPRQAQVSLTKGRRIRVLVAKPGLAAGYLDHGRIFVL